MHIHDINVLDNSMYLKYLPKSTEPRYACIRVPNHEIFCPGALVDKETKVPMTCLQYLIECDVGVQCRI
jgi:hypothetical protein